MKNQQDINQHIEAVLNSADGVSRAEAPPFFYTRLVAKMEAWQHKPSVFEKLTALLTNPIMAGSMLCLFLILNVMAIRGIISVNSASAAASPKTSGIQSFAVEYNLNTASVYPNANN